MSKDVSRRNFIKGMAVGTLTGYFASSAVASTVFKSSLVPPAQLGTMDIGECKSVSVKCISETSWFDNKVLLGNIKDGGGALASQYTIGWTDKGVEAGYNGNVAGGYATLIDIEQLDGSHRKILLDTGWNVDWMTKRFQEEGIDKLLLNDEIDYLFISHDHLDHYWGLEATFQYKPDITMMIPNTFSERSYELLAGAEFPAANLKNSIPHKGKVIKHDVGKIYPIYPGVVAAAFDCPCGLDTFGEQVLIFNIQGKGIATITGCCHMGIISLLEYIKKNIKGGDNVYGIYGGLHISPYEDWDPQFDDLVLSIPRYNVQKLGCNHCTGYITAEKMLAAGIQVIKGTAQHRSKRDIYLGNGDTIVF